MRANLVLSSSTPMSSQLNTPQLDPWSPQLQSQPSPSPLGANPPLAPLDDIPPLSLEPLRDHEDKVDGLHLVADSVAQMKQRAASNMVFHPICLAALAAASAVVYRCAYLPNGEAGLALLLLCGITMTYLATIRYFSSGYIKLAEQMDWSWLRICGTGEEDLMLGARYGDKIVGVVVLRLEPRLVSTGSAGGKRRSRSMSFRGGKGIIRAWTTDLKHRHQGVGKDLLDATVRLVKERCGKDAEIGFAKEHANSTMLLPNLFNSSFRSDEMRAAKALEGALADWEASKRRKR